MSMWEREEKDKGAVTKEDYKPDPLLSALMKDKPVEQSARIVVVEHLYHIEPSSADPVVADHRFLRWLNTDEQPYARKQRVTRTMTQLDHGWIKHCSMLSIHNPLPLYDNNPEESVKEEDKKKSVKVWLDAGSGGFILLCEIPPGESLRLPQVNASLFHVELASGDQVKIDVLLFPV